MIVLDASMAVQILLWYIDDPKCVDIMPLYNKVTKEAATDQSSDDDRECSIGESHMHIAHYHLNLVGFLSLSPQSALFNLIWLSNWLGPTKLKKRCTLPK